MKFAGDSEEHRHAGLCAFSLSHSARALKTSDMGRDALSSACSGRNAFESASQVSQSACRPAVLVPAMAVPPLAIR